MLSDSLFTATRSFGQAIARRTCSKKSPIPSSLVAQPYATASALGDTGVLADMTGCVLELIDELKGSAISISNVNLLFAHHALARCLHGIIHALHSADVRSKVDLPKTERFNAVGTYVCTKVCMHSEDLIVGHFPALVIVTHAKLRSTAIIACECC